MSMVTTAPHGNQQVR